MDASTSPLQSGSAAGPDITAKQLLAREVLAQACDMILPGLSADLSWSSDVRDEGA